MPRYDDDRHGSARLYVGHLSSRTRTRDVERLFSKYGRIRDLDMKRDFAFVEFSDPRDADDARYRLDGRDIDGSRIVVEFAKGMPRGSGSGYGSREISSSRGGGPPPGAGRCFNCGVDGHWARDCTAGDWKNKCYRCGDRGHIERNCKNSPKKLKREQSYSRSPVKSRSRSPPRRRRNRSRSGSYSRSRSPVRTEKEPSLELAARSESMEPTVDNVSPPLKDNSISPNDEKNVESLKAQSNGDATNGQDHSPIDEPSP